MKKRFTLLLTALVLLATMVLPIAASAATYYYVSGTSSVKLRANPNTDAETKSVYRKDFAVVSYKKYDKNWAYVHLSDGGQGYMMTKYLKASSSFTGYIRKDDTPLRSGPAETYGQSATLYQGDKVKVMTHGNTWSYVSGTAGTGYVKNTQISSTEVKRSGNAGTPYTAWVVNPNNRTVNVRVGPGKKYAIDVELDPGTQVTVEHVENGWCELSEPVSGWMMSNYLTKTPPAPTPTLAPGETPTPTKAPTTSKRIRYITSPNGKSVNVRHGPNEKGYAVVATIAVGSEVTVLSSENGWSRITGSGITSGYVKNSYLTSLKPGTTRTPKPGETPKPTKEPFASFTGTVYSENGRSVNLRQGAGMGYATLTQVPSGTQVTVSDETSGWYKVSFDEFSGWMKKEYVKK